MSEASIINHDKIRSLREARGWTQLQAAEAAGIKNRQDWNSIEKGTRPNLTVSTLAKIAAALQCDPRNLLVAPEKKPKKPKG